MPVLPARVDSCECGAKRTNVETVDDGITTAYYCGACGELLIDDVTGAEP